MASILPQYAYDIFISYRQNDNKYDGWVTEFVDNLQKELDATLKNPVSIYFDANPHDGIQDTHVVGESLKKKLKCLIFIPILSQTYCDEKSFAWQHEFLAFNEMAKVDELGMNITLSSGNVASRILPVRIHEIDAEDQQLFENTTGSPLRVIDFIYKEAGVNRSLKPGDDKKDNLNGTSYRNQMNKVANALKDLGTSIVNQNEGRSEKQDTGEPASRVPENKSSKKGLYLGLTALLLLIIGFWGYSTYFSSGASEIENSKGNKSIAVLPFTNMSADKDQDYFCAGIAEDIRYNLSQLEGLVVKSRTSSFAFKDQDLDILEIGAKLNVSTILEGSVQKSGNKLRVTVQLINVKDGFQLWSKRYDRELEDVFVIKDEIAKNIVKALAIKLSPAEKQKLEKIKTQDVQAYDYYIRGRDYFYKGHEDKVQLSIQMFKKAIEIDNSYALAYTGMADSYAETYMYFDKTDVNLEQALNASQRALELDPKLAEAHASHGLVLSQSNQFEEAEKEFKTAISLNSRLFGAYYQYGRMSKAMGKHQQAAILFEKAVELEPENYLPITFLVGAYKDLNMKIKMLVVNQQAVEVFRSHLDLNPDDPRALYLGANCLIIADKTDEALIWLEKSLVINPNEISVLYNAACVYSLLGQIDKGIDYLDRAIKGGFAFREWIENDSDLDNIRDDPRFQEIIDRIK